MTLAAGSAKTLTRDTPAESGVFVFYRDVGSDPAARVEPAVDPHPTRRSGGNKVVQNEVRHILMERTVIAVLLQVHLQRFQLEALHISDVSNRDGPVVGLPGLWANRGELGADRLNDVIAARVWVVESFQQIFEVVRHRFAWCWR